MDRERLEKCAKALERNGFAVTVADNAAAAGKYIRGEIKRAGPCTVSYGDSMTLYSTGVLDWVRSEGCCELIDGFDESVTREERLERRRQGLLADLFMTGVNAVSMSGTLHWLDMIGNRIAPVAFGPKSVILAVGRNKVCDSITEAAERVRGVAAPLNVARHEGFRTPCAATGKCADCRSPQRICNTHMIMERCYPPGRITVVLIDEDLGL